LPEKEVVIKLPGIAFPVTMGSGSYDEQIFISPRPSCLKLGIRRVTGIGLRLRNDLSVGGWQLAVCNAFG